jgi:hypothetical protein
VPLLLAGASTAPSNLHLTEEAARQICAEIRVPPDPATLSALREIFAQSYHVNDLVLLAENNYFFNRVAVPEVKSRPTLSSGANRIAVNHHIRYSIDSHYLPAVLPRAQAQSFNVRITNRSKSILTSTGPQPVHLSYLWYTASGQRLSTAESLRTQLPIDLMPGRSLTIPMSLQTPDVEGELALDILLVHETIAWLHQFARRHPVTITPRPLPRPWEAWTCTQIYHGGYDPDHAAARQLLVQELERLDRSRLRVLEVGGCCYPMTLGLPYEIHCVDIDMQTLQVGHLRFGRGSNAVRFVCADAAALPYQDQSFDCVVMFSTLHHFADPTRVLDGLRRLLKPGGFIAALCEPTGHYGNGGADKEFLGVLEQGINEQTFTLQEYHHMFTRAKLHPTRVIVDVGSLKAFLSAA